MPATAALATLILVAACSGVSEPADRPGARELLRNHLSVASAALAAGQPAVARRLYLSLAERFDDSPEPVLGLGYISLHNLDLEAARRQFLRAAGLAQASPATRGEALLGAGRTALALGDTQAARQHLLDARALVQDPSSVMWIENGLAVAAVLEADYETAETHYTEALRQPSAHPRIAANFVRMLIASGQINAAAGIYERYGASYWEEEDSHALQNLLDTARQQSMPPRRVDTRLLLDWPSPDPPLSNASQGLGPSTGVALVGASGLTLRLTGEAGWAVPPAADAAFAVPDYIGVHRPRPASGVGEATALKPPSTKASFALRLGVPILYPARSAITPPPGATVPGFAAPPGASPSPVLLSAAVATTPSTVAASAPTTERDAIPVPMPSSVGAAPVLMNVVPEPDSAWFEKEPLGSADFNGDTWSDASFLHPILPPDPIGLTRGATPAPSQPMIEGHALSGPMPSSSSPSSAPFNGLWEPEAAFSQGLILSAADVGHSSMSRASFLQSVFLLDLTMLQSGTTATASDSAREPALASFVDAFYSGAAPSSRSHVWDQGAAWPKNTTLTAADLGLDSWFERVFLQHAFSLDRAIPSSNTTTFAADPTSESDAALLTTALLSRDEPTLLNGEGERQAAWYESAAPVASAPDRVRTSDKPSARFSASFASAPANIGSNVRLTEHAWTGGAAPDSATPSLLFASAEELPNLDSQPLEHHPGDALPNDEWIVLLGKSRRWHLDSPAKAVAAASPEIADVQLLSPTVLYVIGKNAGNTSISVLGENGSVLKRDVLVVIDIEPLRALLGADPDLQGVQVQRLARGVALTGAVGSAGAAERAVGLAAASFPEGMLVENNLEVGLDLGPLRSLMAGEPGLDGVQVQRVARGVALSGEVASVATADRAFRLAMASLPEGLLVENNLRVALDVGPLRALLGADPDLQGVQVQRLARGVALTGAVGSAGAAERAVGLAAASILEGMLVENNLEVGLDLAPLRSLMAGEPGLDGVQVQRVARGVALSGEVASVATADRAFRLAMASLPEGLLVENNLRVALDVGPLRALLGADPDLQGVQVQRLARGVALTGAVGSAGAAERAVGLAAASFPEGMLVENNLEVGLDLGPLRSLMAGEPGLDGVQVQRVARGVALSGEVSSEDEADRAFRLAAASLPEGMSVENNLRVALDVGPLRALLGADPDLQGVQVQRLARGVALSGEVGSPAAAERAVGLAAASIPEDLLVENNLRVALDVGPLRALLGTDPELRGVQVQPLARGVALTGEVGSPEAAERADRLALASIPEGMLVENSLRVALDVGPLRALLAVDPDLKDVRAQAVSRGVALSGEVGSAAAAKRAVGLAAASIPEDMLIHNNLEVGLDLGPLRSLMAGEPGLDGVQVQRVARGVALSGEVSSEDEADRALRLAAASLPEGLPVESNLRLTPNVDSLGALFASDPDFGNVLIQRLERGVVLSGEVDSPAVAQRAVQLAVASLPQDMLVQSNLVVGLDLAPLRALIVGEPELRKIQVRRVARGITLSGEIGSAAAADRALRLAAASLPEDILVESSLRIVPDVEALRVLFAADPILQGVRVKRLARGVALSGEVASQGAADRAVRLTIASLPQDMLVESNLEVGLDLGPLRSLMAGEPGLGEVQVHRVARGVALSGEVNSEAAVERAVRLASASLPQDLLVESNLRIETDLQPLRTLLASEPDLYRVRVQRVARGVALSGEVGSAAASERAQRFATASLPKDALVDNHMSITGPQQVNLEVQIAEVQRSIAEDFGFNWEIFGHSNDPLGFGFRIGRGLPDGTSLARPERLTGQPHPSSPPNVGTNDDGDVLLSVPSTSVDGLLSPTFMLQRAWDNVGLNGFVDALAKAGLANVLARPNVTANSGETASFFSGGEYPLPTGFDDGVIVFEYKKYGVLLDFVPTIIDENRIALTVRPEVSEPSQDNSVQVVAGVNVPVINVRRAQTTVEVGDGESIVIAGLFRSASNDVESGIPLLKDLPLVGAIFGHSSMRSDELELIVTITARLVDAIPHPTESGMAAFGRIDKFYY